MPPNERYSLKYNVFSFDINENNYKIVFTYSKNISGGMDTDVKEGLVGLLWSVGYTHRVKDLTDLKSLYKELLGELKLCRFINLDDVTKNKLQTFLSKPYKEHIKPINDKVSVASLLFKANYIPFTYTFERGELFSKIKKLGSSLSHLPVDKWNPSDVFLIKKSFDPKSLEKIETLTQLNKLFIRTYDGKSEIIGRSVLGISLKELVAQGGKAKSFLSRFGDGFNLTKQEQALSDRTKQDRIQLIRRKINGYVADFRKQVEYTFEPKGKKKLPNISMSFASYKILDFILNQNNPDIFVDIAKYAMGTGNKNINPPFFKIIGDHNGVATVSSSNKYETIKKIGKINIIDRESSNGILIKMKFEIGDVTLNIRSLGYTQSTIEIERQF